MGSEVNPSGETESANSKYSRALKVRTELGYLRNRLMQLHAGSTEEIWSRALSLDRQISKIQVEINESYEEQYEGERGDKLICDLVSHLQQVSESAEMLVAERKMIRGSYARIAQQELERQIAADQERFRSDCAKITEIVSPHGEVLRRVYSQTAYADHFGLIVTDKWDKELSRFLNGIVEPALGKSLDDHLRKWSRNYIHERFCETSALQDDGLAKAETNSQLSATEYEQYCAQKLRSSGWETTLTKASGDQGADIVALRGQTKLVIQCKRYSSPVGNAAVQEVIAAKAFYEANGAVVVSTAPFTVSARQLAGKAGVLLLHDSELHELSQLLVLNGSESTP